MVTIRIKDYVSSCVSNDDGLQIYTLLKQILDRGDRVTISFDGVYSLPTSFVNAAFIELLDDYQFDDIKARLAFKDTTRQINHIIKKRFLFESERAENTSCCA